MATTFLRSDSLRKHPFLTNSSPLGTFRAGERLRLRGRNSILMTQINVFIINPIVVGFQIWICTILLVFWSILVKSCVHLPTSRSKTQMLLLENTIFHKCWLFCQRLFWLFFRHLTFVAFCLSYTPSTNQPLPPDSGQILRHQYGISVAETQTFLLAKSPQWRRASRNGCFRRLERRLQ